MPEDAEHGRQSSEKSGATSSSPRTDDSGNETGTVDSPTSSVNSEKGGAEIQMEKEDVMKSLNAPALTDGDHDCQSNRLYVSNIPFRWREADLLEFFADYHPVAALEIVYNERGSKGFGFVTIEDSKMCDAARLKLNNSVIDGRKIEVRWAHKQKRTNAPSNKAKNPTPAHLLAMVLQQQQEQQHNLNLNAATPQLGGIQDVQALIQLQQQASLSGINPMILNLLLANPMVAGTTNNVLIPPAQPNPLLGGLPMYLPTLSHLLNVGNGPTGAQLHYSQPQQALQYNLANEQLKMQMQQQNQMQLQNGEIIGPNGFPMARVIVPQNMTQQMHRQQTDVSYRNVQSQSTSSQQDFTKVYGLPSEVLPQMTPNNMLSYAGAPMQKHNAAFVADQVRAAMSVHSPNMLPFDQNLMGGRVGPNQGMGIHSMFPLPPTSSSSSSMWSLDSSGGMSTDSRKRTADSYLPHHEQSKILRR